MLFLLPLLSCIPSAEFGTILTATDASPARVGGSECLLVSSPEQVQELCRTSVFKGHYSDLDEVVAPGLARWEHGGPIGLKALRPLTENVSWNHVCSIPHKGRKRFDLGEGRGHTLALFRRLRNLRRRRQRSVYRRHS